jgi:monofunctional biosynthetic peptidoglycan transglycosylase
VRARRGWRRALRWLAISVAGFLAVSVAVVAVFRVLPVPGSAFMFRYQLAGLMDPEQRPALRHDWVGWKDIADPAKLAVIAAEDQRFPDHFGFDLAAIEKAIDHNRRGGRVRGASTISQQTAKNLFLWPGRSWLRKGLEVWFTLLIEALWSKERLLTVYLNLAEFGEGIYGVEAAAQTYFGKPAASLSAHEASLLAAVLPNPKGLRVDAPSGYVASRAAWIRGQMRQLGRETLERL